jgi:hypothetical protein
MTSASAPERGAATPERLRALLERADPAATVLPPSLTQAGPLALAVVRAPDGTETFAALASPGSPLFALLGSPTLALLGDAAIALRGERQPAGDLVLLRGPCDHHNARALRGLLPHLQPVPLGAAASAGCGDRLGLATPGHVRAFQRVHSQPRARDVLPLFAQQSIRELDRTGRTPDDVLADATWGAFAAGWRGPLGADADHLKTPADIDLCAAAGFTFFTFDPGGLVDDAASADPPAEVARKVTALPWRALESSPADLRRRLSGRPVDLGGRALTLDDEPLLRAAAKYGRAVAHAAALYRHLAAKGVPFEVELSVDETETPTTLAEHVYVASELRRLDVEWVSLAPRYLGAFEKAVDFRPAGGAGLDALRASLEDHAAIARAFGGYKLSLHSGSDKFSVYPLLVEAAQGRVHLKTAGTSYLEALRVLARGAPALFRTLAAFARGCYTADRATYHVSAELSDWPDLDRLEDADLPALLDRDPTRQILHVTFGSVLRRYGGELKAALRARRDDYAAALEAHFVRHLAPFTQ